MGLNKIDRAIAAKRFRVELANLKELKNALFSMRCQLHEVARITAASKVGNIRTFKEWALDLDVFLTRKENEFTDLADTLAREVHLLGRTFVNAHTTPEKEVK